MTLGQRISQLRKGCKYSQEYVAEQLLVSRQAVSKWETDQTEPDTSNLIALAQLFHVTVEYLAVGEEKEFVIKKDTKRFSAKSIVGCILIAAGLFSFVLGLLFLTSLAIAGIYFVMAGFLCFVSKKNIWYIVLWTCGSFTFFIAFVLASFNPIAIFMPPYLDGFNMHKIVGCLFWIWLITAIVITVIKGYRENKQKK